MAERTIASGAAGLNKQLGGLARLLCDGLVWVKNRRSTTTQSPSLLPPIPAGNSLPRRSSGSAFERDDPPTPIVAPIRWRAMEIMVVQGSGAHTPDRLAVVES
jgi:hypothetical protein